MLPRRTTLAAGLGLATLPLAAPAVRAQGGPVLKLAVLNDQSGPYRDQTGPGSVAAARLAAKEAEAAFGIRAEVIAGDHQNKPDVGATLARRWFDQDGVDAVLDVPTSSVALAVAGVTKQKNKVLLISGAGTADLTGSACSPNHVHWTYDTYMLAKVAADAVKRAGGDRWFFVTADYAFGHALERDTSAFVKAGGGAVVGQVRHPFPGTTDFSSYLLQAQAARAGVLALANSGDDTLNALKQAAEFGLARRGMRIVALSFYAPDVASLPPAAAEGLTFVESFYAFQDDRARRFTERLRPEMPGRRLPNQIHAGTYGAAYHYLRAAAAMGAEAARADGAATIRKMKELPTDDDAFGPGRIRADGRKIHAVKLLEAKAEAKRANPDDLCGVLLTVPGEQAFRPEGEGGCTMPG